MKQRIRKRSQPKPRQCHVERARQFFITRWMGLALAVVLLGLVLPVRALEGDEVIPLKQQTLLIQQFELPVTTSFGQQLSHIKAWVKPTGEPAVVLQTWQEKGQSVETLYSYDHGRLLHIEQRGPGKQDAMHLYFGPMGFLSGDKNRSGKQSEVDEATVHALQEQASHIEDALLAGLRDN